MLIEARRSSPSSVVPAEPKRQGASGVVLGLLLVVVLLVAAFVALSPDAESGLRSAEQSASSFLSSIFGGLGITARPPLNYTIYSPLIGNGSAKISYPPDYDTLAAYALSLINQDRPGLQAVSLSPNPVAQQHANSMLRYGYFSHYDTQGYSPYMRYSLLGGKGAVGENVAYDRASGPIFYTTSEVEGAIRTLEYQMMNNDSQCCNNGHRINILNPLHNRVSIGVAYDGTVVYFVEDFENYYIALTISVSSTYDVSIAGTTLQAFTAPKAVYITYDSPPTAETPAQLNAGPHEYGPGTLTGGVLQPCSFGCPSFQSGITVYADTWKFTSTQDALAFSLHDFIQHYGAGVYTIYAVTGSDTGTAITSISVFVTG
ncbi:MAG: CAP domain-containing protein [archaeon]|nr:MAG: CAP domain-containing protein [archaeon]